MRQIVSLRIPENLDVGVLIVRVCTGIVFILHRYPKMFGGVVEWAKYGALGMESIGVEFFLPFWGFMAAFAEFIGGICLVLGLFSRPALILIFLTMIFAGLFHLTSGKGSPAAAIQWGVIAGALFTTGPGKYSLDHKLFSESS